MTEQRLSDEQIEYIYDTMPLDGSKVNPIAFARAIVSADRGEPLTNTATDVIEGYKAGLAGEPMGMVSAAFDCGWTSGNAERAAAPSTPQPAPEWADIIEQRLLTWRQRLMNKSGDRLALDDFMGQESIDDLVDFVCAPIATPQPDTVQVPREPTPEQCRAGSDESSYYSTLSAKAVAAVYRAMIAAAPKESKE